MFPDQFPEANLISLLADMFIVVVSILALNVVTPAMLTLSKFV